MALHIKKSQSVVLLVAKEMCLRVESVGGDDGVKHLSRRHHGRCAAAAAAVTCTTCSGSNTDR